MRQCLFIGFARPFVHLRQAVILLDSDLLAGIDVREPAWEDWLGSERHRFGKLACDALVALGTIDLAQGRAADGLVHAEDCIRRDIFREDAHRLTIQAYVALGRRAEALKHYQGLVERMKQDLNTTPEAATVRVYECARMDAGTSTESRPAAIGRKPSIAVLPFANLSNDPEQDYFADGMVDEIITALSRIHWLFVIARNSSFTYKGRAADVKQVGRDLDVRYVLEGSVRKAGNRVRIGGQLIDTETGAAIWADRIEGELQDIFDLQDKVTAKVVGAIAPKLERAEIERSKRKPTGSLDAYDYYLRGLPEVHKWTREGNEKALTHFYRAIELDPEFASAYGMAARCYSQRKAGGWVVDRQFEIIEVQRLAHRAVELGPDDAVALSSAGLALAFVAGELEAGDALIEKGVALNPNLAWAWLFSGWVKAWLGEPDDAIVRITRAMNLSPQDPSRFSMSRGIAFAHFIAGRYEEAITTATATFNSPQNAFIAMATAAASATHLGRMEEARRIVSQLLAADPTLCCANLRERFRIKRDDDFARWSEGLRRAGLPE